MPLIDNFKPRTLSLALALLAATAHNASAQEVALFPSGDPGLLTDPFLQNPSAKTVNVVWMTNFPGVEHKVLIDRSGGNSAAPAQPDSSIPRGTSPYRAETVKLERVFEDGASKLDNAPGEVMQRKVYRHEAVVSGLRAGEALQYWVQSRSVAGETLEAGPFRLQPLPAAGAPLQILLTSDQQERFNTLANYQKVAELFP